MKYIYHQLSYAAFFPCKHISLIIVNVYFYIEFFYFFIHVLYIFSECCLTYQQFVRQSLKCEFFPEKQYFQKKYLYSLLTCKNIFLRKYIFYKRSQLLFIYVRNQFSLFHFYDISIFIVYEFLIYLFYVISYTSFRNLKIFRDIFYIHNFVILENKI